MTVTPRPTDWLAQLEAGGSEAYEQLLRDCSGSLALAAHKLALTRLLAEERTDVPTDRELFASAHTIAIHVEPRLRVPPMRDLVDECTAHDLLVLTSPRQ